MLNIAAIFLAGGDGRRFGDAGKCRHTLPRLLAAARACGLGRLVVGGDHAWLAELPGTVNARDAAAGCGPLAGIVGGLRHCQGCAAAIVIPGDARALGAGHLRRLVGAWRRRGHAIAAMQRERRRTIPARPGLLGILPAEAWGVAEAQLARRSCAVHRLWRLVGARPMWLEPAEAADLDRPSDLRKYRAGRLLRQAFRGNPDRRHRPRCC